MTSIRIIQIVEKNTKDSGFTFLKYSSTAAAMVNTFTRITSILISGRVKK
jgi:hypothetical protein